MLNQDTYLIKDGSLQYQKVPKSSDFRELAKYKNNYRRVVGVSKSFNPEFLEDHRNRSNAAKIAKTALKNNTTLKVETLKSGLMNEKDYNKIVDPKKMIYPA